VLVVVASIKSGLAGLGATVVVGATEVAGGVVGVGFTVGVDVLAGAVGVGPGFAQPAITIIIIKTTTNDIDNK